MATEYKQSTIAEMIESERLMVREAHERYPGYYSHAEEAAHFLSAFVRSIKLNRYVFGMFLSQVKKHTMLALFSTVRLHRVQAWMNLRQVLEAGAAAAFAIANPEREHFVDTDEYGILDPSKELAKKRYDWLAKHYPDGSAAIKGMKAIINVAAAHANLVSVDNNFRFNEQSGSFDAPFFDIEDEYLVKTDLWMIGNIAYGLMDLFYGVNRDRNVVTFVDDFASRLGKLVSDNKALRAEVTASERYKRTQERLAGVASSNVNPSSNLSP